MARDWRLLARAAVANYAIVPAVAVGLLLLYRAPPMVAAGLLVVAVCPGAPYGPPLTGLAKGSVAAAVGLMVVLAASSAVVAPLLLRALLPLVAGGAPPVNAVKMVCTLALTQFLPLCVGLFVRQRRPALAARLRRPAGKLTAVLNLALLGLVLYAQFRVLLAIRPMAYAGMAALLVGSAVAGWLLGGGHAETRRAMTLAAAVRNVGVGLVIVTAAFPGTPAVVATTAYGLFQTVVMVVVALLWGRWASGPQPTPAAIVTPPGAAGGAIP